MLYLVSVSIHVLSAIVWVGGMAFISLVMVPLARRMSPPGAGAQMLRQTGQHFRWVAWPCIGLLVGTGIINAWHRGALPDVLGGTLLKTTSGHLLLAKVGVVAVMIVLSFLHDFVLGPLATSLEADARQVQGTPDPTRLARASRTRLITSWLARLNVLLALAVVTLAALVVRT